MRQNVKSGRNQKNQTNQKRVPRLLTSTLEANRPDVRVYWTVNGALDLADFFQTDTWAHVRRTIREGFDAPKPGIARIHVRRAFPRIL